MSTHCPMFDQYVTLSSLSKAPETIAEDAELGDPLHAFAPSFPAATLTATPTCESLSTARTRGSAAQRGVEQGPPRLIETMEGRFRSETRVATNSSAASISLVSADKYYLLGDVAATRILPPDPSAPITFTPNMEAPGATPIVFPPTVPATWVP